MSSTGPAPCCGGGHGSEYDTSDTSDCELGNIHTLSDSEHSCGSSHVDSDSESDEHTGGTDKRKRRISRSKATRIAGDMARLLPDDEGDAAAVLSAFVKLALVSKLMAIVDPQWAAVSESLKAAFAATKPKGAPRSDFRAARAAVMVFLNGPWVKAYSVTRKLCSFLGIDRKEFRDAGKRRARAFTVDESEGQLPKDAIFKDPITRGGGRSLSPEEKWTVSNFWLSMSKPSPSAKDQMK